MPDVLLQHGSESLNLHVPDGKLVQPRIPAPQPALADVRRATENSLETPMEFPTLRQALTPDDHLAIVIQENINGFSEVLEVVLRHLHSAGLQMDQLTVLVQGSLEEIARPWLEALSSELRGFHLEVHRPDLSKMAYLASTKAGRRIYLNRLIVDADQVIIITKARFDPIHGVAVGLADIFPGYSDTPTLQELTRHLHDAVPSVDHPYPVWKETEEVGWQLGLPFVVCVVEGQGTAVAQVLAGQAAAVRIQAEKLLRQQYVLQLPYQVDLVVGTLGGTASQQNFVQLTEALFRASRAVHQGGNIALVCQASGILPPGSEIVSQAETAVAGLSYLRQHPEINRLPWWYLARALEQCRGYVASHWQQEVIESLFLVPLDNPAQIQNLIDQAKTVVIAHDLDRCMIELKKQTH